MSNCPVEPILRLLSGEWTSHIIWTLGEAGPTRHGELKRKVEGISGKVLTDRLRMLESKNVVRREHEPSVPPKVTYCLTDFGLDLHRGLIELSNTAGKWLPSS